VTGVAGGFLDQMQVHTSNAAIVRVGKPWCSPQWYGSAEVVDRTDATVGLGRSGLVLSEHSGQYLILANLEAVHIFGHRRRLVVVTGQRSLFDPPARPAHRAPGV